ncbi:tubulin polyglutamylase TTLL5-like isoform X3 [Lineus longissimus]|uniref:tubulin polyglutamylase TTLL5-like isoform X3 n=1 Tax=Lineus longissimus TaxID=88925 RepID=UPI00315CE5F2
MPSSVMSSDAASRTTGGAEDDDSSDSQYTDESETDNDHDPEHPNIIWTGYNKKIPVVLFKSDVLIHRRADMRSIGEKYHLAYKIVKTECKLIRSVLAGHGFHEAHPNSNDFNLMWTGSHLKPYVLRNLTEFQKVNHFPRSYEITRKDRLFKNVQRLQQTKGFRHFDFIPQSFVLPGEFQDFCTAFLKDKGPYIVKPIASSRGRGIFLVNHPEQVPLDEQIIVSRYLSNPLLVDGFKFDIRLYVAVTSYDPLLIYLYEEGLTRFSTVKYDKATKHIRNQCMHLTNYSVNKKNQDYVQNDDADVEDYGNKWSLGALLRYLRSEGKDTTGLMLRIEDVVIKTIISAEMHVATACRMFMPFKGNCFEVYGFDILIDENLRPWILEVNLSPSLACDAPLDLKIKSNMVSDLFSLVGFVCHDPMMRRVHQSKRNVDVASKTAARTLKQRPGSTDRKRQRPNSASSVSSIGPRPSNRTASGLTSEEIRIVRRAKEEAKRRGGWVRVFPSPDSWDLYGPFLQSGSSHNLMLHQRLFPERNSQPTRPGTSTLMKSKSLHIHSTPHPQLMLAQATRCNLTGSHSLICPYASVKGNTDFTTRALKRTVLYERKLSSSLSNKKKRKKQHPRPHTGPLAEGIYRGSLVKAEVVEVEVSSQTDLSIMSREEMNEQRPTAKEETKIIQLETSEELKQSRVVKGKENVEPMMDEGKPPVYKPPSSVGVKPAPVSRLSRSAITLPEEKFNIVEILEGGGTMSKVQARTAFATYLTRVKHRLISENGTHEAGESEEANEQMDLVLRFLKRAAGNLQQPFRVIVPSRRLPITDRRRILAKQLGDFVHIYGKETEQLRQRRQLERRQWRRPSAGSATSNAPTENAMDDDKFNRFVTTANESELEEVLTTYTKLNKSASIFLGGNRSGMVEVPVHRIPHTPNNSETSLVKRKEGFENREEAESNSAQGTPVPPEKRDGETKMQPSKYYAHNNPMSSYSGAVAIYSTKLKPNVKQRPVSASTVRSASSRVMANRPMSAVNHAGTSISRVDANGEVLDEQYVEEMNDALTRLQVRQQKRQYAAHKSTNVLSNMQPPPKHAPFQRSNTTAGDFTMTNSNKTAEKEREIEVEHLEEARPPKTADGSQSTPNINFHLNNLGAQKIRPQSQQNQQVTRYFDEMPLYDSEAVNIYNHSTGGISSNRYAATNGSAIPTGLLQQQQALKQQRMYEQSKALLEQSKAKHQAMVAQAHAARQTDPNSGYTPKPPPAPSGHRKPINASRTVRVSTNEENGQSNGSYGSLQYGTSRSTTVIGRESSGW